MTVQTDRYTPGEYVRVIARVPADTHKGQVGQVERTYADCGDMMHVVRFEDGQTAHYYVEELLSTTRAGALKSQPNQQES
jgi:hypothetical protein